DQLDVITLALHFHTGAMHAAPPFGLLLVGVIAVTGPGCTGNRGANQRALAAILLARGRCAHGSAGTRTQSAINVGSGDVTRLLVFVRIIGSTTGKQGSCAGADEQTG